MSVQNSKWILGLFLSATACTGQAIADETYQLVYHFRAGQFFHVEVDDRSEMLTQNGAVRDKNNTPLQSRSIQQTQTLKSYRVVSTEEDGETVLEPIVEKVRMSSQSGEQPIIRYDSTTDITPPREFETVAGTIGRSLARFHVAPNGKLLKVTMLVKDVPKNFSDAAEKVDPAINFLVAFPEKAIKIGDQWSEIYETRVSVGTKLNYPAKLIRTYELKDVTNNVATIKFRTSLLTPTTDPEILRQLLPQTPTGQIEFDLQQGCIVSRSIHINDSVVNAFGPQTLLRARGESTEKLVVETGAGKVPAASNSDTK